MNNMTNLQKLTALIVEAVPSIMELKMGCRILNKKTEQVFTISHRTIIGGAICLNGFYEDNTTWVWEKYIHNFEILGRDITLEDVSIALQKKESKMEREYERVILLTCDDELDGYFEIAELEWKGIKSGSEIKWLPNTPLSDQSEETINKLLEILQ